MMLSLNRLAKEAGYFKTVRRIIPALLCSVAGTPSAAKVGLDQTDTFSAVSCLGEESGAVDRDRHVSIAERMQEANQATLRQERAGCPELTG